MTLEYEDEDSRLRDELIEKAEDRFEELLVELGEEFASDLEHQNAAVWFIQGYLEGAGYYDI